MDLEEGNQSLLTERYYPDIHLSLHGQNTATLKKFSG
jgi:hypothetical protein